MRRALWLVLFAGALLALTAPARALEPGPLLARLEKTSQSVDTLAGEFVQKSRVKLFKQELVSKGRFYYARPHRIRWEYLSPDRSTLIVDGDKATLSAPGAPPQVFDLARDATMRAVFDQLSAWLGGGPVTRLTEDYVVQAGGTETQPILLLQPKAGGVVARAFSRIELHFDKQLLLRTILLREASGDEKQIDFTKLERNVKLPADAFKP